MKSNSLRIQSGNLTLAANTYGEPENPPVLLVHGYPDDSHVWQKLVPLLAANYFVINYDVRGCGLSDTPPTRKHYGMRYLMADIFNVIRATSPDRPVHLVGHDWGSIQSWEAVTEPGAERYIASFTTLSGPCLDHIGCGLRDQFTQAPIKSLNQLVHSWYIGLFHLPVVAPLSWKLGLANAWPALLARMENADVEHVPSQCKDGVNGINLYRANISQHLLRPRQRYAQVPVQAIVLKQDNYVTESLLRDLPRWVSDLRRVEMDTGHWGAMLVEADTTAGLISQFIDEKIEAGAADGKALSC